MTKLQQRAESTAKLLTDLTGRTWLPMADDRKDRYAYGCGFIVYDRDARHRMFIFDPHGHGLTTGFRHSVPVWVFSTNCGDLWSAMSNCWPFNDILEQPGVLDAASGRPSPDLPRDYRRPQEQDWRQLRRERLLRTAPPTPGERVLGGLLRLVGLY